MSELFRKIRGALGVGTTWGVMWAAIGAVIGLIIEWTNPSMFYFVNPVVEWAIGMGMYGAVSGFGFAGLLSLREGRKMLSDLSLKRVALWGVLGSAAVPLVFSWMGMFAAGTTVLDIVAAMGVTSLLGGIFAPGSVAIAKRAELQARREAGFLDTGDAYLLE